MKNRFNRLTSKEWLPFQKSWFNIETDEKLYRDSIRFFVKGEDEKSVIFYHGNKDELVKKICEEENIEYHKKDDAKISHYDFVLIDLLDMIGFDTTPDDYNKVKKQVIELVKGLYPKIDHRRFIGIFIRNIHNQNGYFPFAWDLAKQIATLFTLKDEKIGCLETDRTGMPTEYFSIGSDTFYCLYFRKDEKCDGIYKETESRFFMNNKQYVIKEKTFRPLPGWFILKPQPRKKKEILHPAKYPEELVEIFLNEFTNENDNIIDPMSGTGSTQLAALKNNRNAYGTELSDFFFEIATDRCSAYLTLTQESHWEKDKTQSFRILNKDARQITKDDFPPIDYLFTSPPYWDMLNMKGAENQAKRIKEGLQTNYSDRKDDLGNIDDFKVFLDTLVEIYLSIIKIMKPGSFLTIVVKNIKKKGSNYPFAWELSEALQKHLILLPENFWCQDDISIAPYGYGNTWVSNTFHQYCLNFQVPFK